MILFGDKNIKRAGNYLWRAGNYLRAGVPFCRLCRLSCIEMDWLAEVYTRAVWSYLELLGLAEVCTGAVSWELV
jgi:hypothetical protein